MIRFWRPSPVTVESFLCAQSSEPFSYAPIGVTASTSSGRFAVNHKRTKIGSGEAAFIAARDAIRGWHQFELTWMDLWPVDASFEIGQTVAVVAHATGVFWLNACRIVYIIDESGPPCRFGFAYGTLSDHAACGEERFLIEWDRTNDVWYDILAFSRPRHPLARMGYPLFRMAQMKFACDSTEALLDEILQRTG